MKTLHLSQFKPLKQGFIKNHKQAIFFNQIEPLNGKLKFVFETVIILN